MNSVSGIYVILNEKNGKIYIGQAQNIKRRWAEHRSALNQGKHSNRHLQAAWNKYDVKVFRFKVLEYCAIDQLDEREQYHLNIYMPKGVCYNINPSAKTTRGMICSEETRSKISASNIGKVISKEIRQKISNTLKGRPLNDNQHRAIVESNKNRVVSENVKQQFSEIHKKQKGAKFTPEHAQKISDALKGHKLCDETKQKIAEAQRQYQERKRNAME